MLALSRAECIAFDNLPELAPLVLDQSSPEDSLRECNLSRAELAVD
jgi:hypothetical protein